MEMTLIKLLIMRGGRWLVLVYNLYYWIGVLRCIECT